MPPRRRSDSPLILKTPRSYSHSQFLSLKLYEADMRALVLAREVGAITNQDYRQINGTHTLAASNTLRHL